MKDDTISAISTAIGNAGIGIVRMSGENSIEIADKMFSRDLKNISDKSFTVGHILDSEKKIIDEAVILVMRAPKSYTKENVVEFQCHGNSMILREILRRTFELGARPAERGEFTKRAFLNGRIDLSQAQAVMDVIQAKNSAALNLAQQQLAGKTSKNFQEIRRELLEILAHIEALIDFSEEDIETFEIEDIGKKVSEQIEKIKKILDAQGKYKILREGLETAIIGKPNVGKSSLLNFLAQHERAIVTDIPGTTRDSIEEFIMINNIPLKIIDTAGIRQSDNLVEKIGIDKSRELAKNSALILALFDSSQPLTEEDKEIFKLINSDNTIILLTKSDLPQVTTADNLNTDCEVISISTKKNLGFEKFNQAVTDKFNQIDFEEYFSGSERELSILRRVLNHLEDIQKTISAGMEIDFISIDLRSALELLSELTGESVTEDVIDEIFSKFCIGK